MKKLFLVRHGETKANISKIIEGHLPGELSDTGWNQIKALGERLRSETIDVIVSSDLHRVKCTTESISQYHTCPIHFRTELRERYYGGFEGRSSQEFWDALSLSGLTYEEFAPEGGESYRDLLQRAANVIKALMQEFPQKTVLVSAHAGINRAFLMYLLKLPQEAWNTHTLQSNACLNVFDFDDSGNVAQHIVNDTSHLQALTEFDVSNEKAI